jgi:hypothetical protein
VLAQREPVDLDSLGAVLARLPECAGLEAWRITAEVAAATGEKAFWALAEGYVARLAASAGDRAESFTSYASRHLESMKRAGRAA